VPSAGFSYEKLRKILKKVPPNVIFRLPDVLYCKRIQLGNTALSICCFTVFTTELNIVVMLGV